MLLRYFEKILSGKKVKSVFIYNSLIALKDKLNIIKKEYEKKVKNDGTFFNVSKDIIDINKQIQEIFYDFVLEILIVLYKDYKLKNDCTDIIKDIHDDVNMAEEEKIFLKFYRHSIKYAQYFDNFICQFKTVDELRVSLVFSDEYVNVKIKDPKNLISNKINYFKLNIKNK